MPSVTVEIVRDGDDDDEWGDEEEVVVWSNDLHNDSNGGGAHSVDIDVDVPRGEGGHPRGLLVASLANLAISYNVVRVCCWTQYGSRGTIFSVRAERTCAVVYVVL